MHTPGALCLGSFSSLCQSPFSTHISSSQSSDLKILPIACLPKLPTLSSQWWELSRLCVASLSLPGDLEMVQTVHAATSELASFAFLFSGIPVLCCCCLCPMSENHRSICLFCWFCCLKWEGNSMLFYSILARSRNLYYLNCLQRDYSLSLFG